MIRQRCSITFVIALLATVLLYLPGLKGTFLFDDFPNIVDNAALQVTESTPAAWLRAAWASPSSDLQRPLASLSFAANHYLSGLDPWPMKATNLAIHLINGLLLYALLRALLRGAGVGSQGRSSRDEWLATLIAAAWLLHPINLSAVLFVVQRMESLAQLFVLAGLLLYVDARQREAQQRGGSAWRLWLGVPLCTVLGIAAKESAALLPLFALLLEFTVLRHCSRNRRALGAFYTIFLIVPGMLGLAWLLPGVFSEGAYSTRAFTLGQRLLTEPRVLIDYATWIVFPAPDFFSFYRDDYAISTSLLHPWTTLPALLALLAMVTAAWRLRARRPLVALGLAWFLAAHALTATVLPLELVFEHRNYFASIGLLLAAFDLLLPRAPHAPFMLARRGTIVALFALAAFSLGLRAQAWGDPVNFAVTEAARHPDSARATYDLGRTYVVLSNYRADSPNVPRAIAALEAATTVSRASTLPESGLIMVASRTGRRVEPQWWDSMIRKLAAHKPTVEDAGAIKSLTLCQREGHCALDDGKMLQIYLAAINHKGPNPAILYSYAIFAHNRLHDTELAVRLARDAAKSRDVQYQLNLVGFLADIGRRDEAQSELAVLKRRARPGSMDAEMDALAQRLVAPPHDSPQ